MQVIHTPQPLGRITGMETSTASEGAQLMVAGRFPHVAAF